MIWLNLIQTSFYDLKSKKRFFFTLAKYLAFLITILLVTDVISVTILNYYNDMIYGKTAHYRISFSANISESLSENSSYLSLQNTENLTAPILSTTALAGNLNDKNGQITLDRVELRTDTEIYPGKNDRTFAFRGNIKRHVQLKTKLYLDESSEPVSNIERDSFSLYYPDEKLIVAGRMMSKTNEIMMSEYILNHFGVNNPDLLTGKKISLYVDGKPFIKDKILSGVINTDFFNMKRGNSIITDYLSDVGEFTSQVWVMTDSSEMSAYGVQNITAVYYPVTLSCFSDVISYIKNNDISDNVKFFEDSAMDYLLTSNVKTMSEYLLAFLTGSVAIAVILMIINFVNESIRKQNSYYAMLRAVGFRKRTLLTILISEHFIVNFFAVLISVFFSGIITVSFNYAMNKIFGEGLDVTVFQFLISIRKVIPIVSATYIILISTIFVNSQKRVIHELIKN